MNRHSSRYRLLLIIIIIIITSLPLFILLNVGVIVSSLTHTHTQSAAQRKPTKSDVHLDVTIPAYYDHETPETSALKASESTGFKPIKPPPEWVLFAKNEQVSLLHTPPPPLRTKNLKVYVMRHAQAEHNIVPHSTIIDPRLTAFGIEQAKAIHRIRREHHLLDLKDIDRIYYSPHTRTIQTALLALGEVESDTDSQWVADPNIWIAEPLLREFHNQLGYETLGEEALATHTRFVWPEYHCATRRVPCSVCVS